VAIQTLRPDTDWKVRAISPYGGGPATPNLWQSIDDAAANDATGITATANYPDNVIWIGFTNATVAANQRVKQVRLRVRHARSTTGTGMLEKITITTRDPNISTVNTPRDQWTYSSVTFVEDNGIWRTKAPGNVEWTATILARIQAELFFYAGQNGATWNRVSEVYLDVETNDQPTVTGVTTSNVTTTTRPTVGWTFGDTENDAQTRYQVIVYSAAQYGAAGFVAGTSAWTWNSGAILGDADNLQVGVDLAQGVTYRAYVRAAQDFNGVAWYSAWTNDAGWTINTVPQNAPTLATSLDTARSRAVLSIVARVNRLDADTAGFETTVGSWTAGANTTRARSTAQFKSGVASMSLTSVAAGNMSATTPTGTAGYAVQAGKAYTVLASFRTAVSARSTRVDVVWYTAAGATVSTDTGPTLTDAANWTAANHDRLVTAPATAAFAAIVVNVLATGAAAEVHYVDEVYLSAGDVATYAPGGADPDTTTSIEYADMAEGTENYANPEIAGGLTTSLDGYGHRTAADTLTNDPADTFIGGSSVAWGITAAGSVLDIGFAPGLLNRDLAFPAPPGQAVIASVYLKASAAGTYTLGVGPVDGVGTAVGADLTTSVALTTAWARYFIAATMPAGAAMARLSLTNATGATGQTVRVDAVQWELAAAGQTAPEAWTVGQGLALEWEAVRLAAAIDPPAATQEYTVGDFELAPGIPRLYRARNNYAPANTANLASVDIAASMAVVYTPATGRYVLKDPLQPERNTTLLVLEGTQERIEEDVTSLKPSGGDYEVSFSDFMGGVNGQLQLYTVGEREWAPIYDLIRQPRTLLLDLPEGGHRFIRIKRREWPRPGPLAAIQRTVTLEYSSAARPPDL
jgi:hypothetical protein